MTLKAPILGPASGNLSFMEDVRQLVNLTGSAAAIGQLVALDLVNPDNYYLADGTGATAAGAAYGLVQEATASGARGTVLVMGYGKANTTDGTGSAGDDLSLATGTDDLDSTPASGAAVVAYATADWSADPANVYFDGIHVLGIAP